MGEFRLFLEEVYGNNAVVYHRTKSLRNIDAIALHGFRPGAGDAYGAGLYCTFDLDSQLRQAMVERYGPVLVKFGVRLDNFLILDYDVARRVYKDGYTLVDQLRRLGRVDLLEEFAGESANLENYVAGRSPGGRFTSAVAMELVDAGVGNNTPGLLFTGGSDGRVCVIYRPAIAKPLAYAEHGADDGSAVLWGRHLPGQDRPFLDLLGKPQP